MIADFPPQVYSDLELLASSRGFDSLWAVLTAYPTATYHAILDLLGSSLPPLALVRAAYREARRLGVLRAAVMDALCRVLHEKLPQGWGLGDNPEWHAVLAVSRWASELEVLGESPELRDITAAIGKSLLDARPPAGWLPQGPGDPLLEAMFATWWPEDIAPV